MTTVTDLDGQTDPLLPAVLTTLDPGTPNFEDQELEHFGMTHIETSITTHEMGLANEKAVPGALNSIQNSKNGSAAVANEKSVSSPSTDPTSSKKPTKHIIDVMVEIMQRRDGKDKTLKIIQYTGKLLIRMGKLSQLRALFTRFPVDAALAPLVAELSMFRKIIKLFDWVKTVRELQKADEIALVDWVDLYTEIMDDLYMLSKIGTIRKSAAGHFARHADLGWFSAILLNLWSKSLVTNKRTLAWQLDVSKLLFDLAFCSVDVFELDIDSSWQIVTGLASGIISYYKIYKKVT